MCRGVSCCRVFFMMLCLNIFPSIGVAALLPLLVHLGTAPSCFSPLVLLVWLKLPLASFPYIIFPLLAPLASSQFPWGVALTFFSVAPSDSLPLSVSLQER